MDRYGSVFQVNTAFFSYPRLRTFHLQYAGKSRPAQMCNKRCRDLFHGVHMGNLRQTGRLGSIC